MTAVAGVAGPAGTPSAPRPTSAPSAPPGAATFEQALAAASKSAAPATSAVPTATPGAAPSITLGHMLRLSAGGQAPVLAPPPPSTAAVSAASVDAGSAPAPGASGMVRPAEGRISSEFGPRIHPVTGERRPHGGIDVAAPVGTPIRAADAGAVTFAGVRGGYGNLIIVDHGGGRETYYAHNNTNAVSVGDRVSAGARIGDIGATGRVTGPHLHFEVRIDGTPVDPRSHVDF